MAALAEREGMLAAPRSGAGVPALVEARCVDRLVAAKQGTLLKREAERLLGVGRKTLVDLIACGLLPQVPPAERVTFQRGTRVRDVERLVREMTARLDQGDARGRRRGRDMVRMSGASGGHANAVDVCRAVLAGKLRPRGVDPSLPGVGALLFDYREVQAVFGPSAKGTMSTDDAAAALGVCRITLRPWLRAGLLRVERRDVWSERGRRVTAAALDEFRATYVTAKEVAERAGLPSGRWTAERLRFMGLHPVLEDGTYDRAGMRLFRRADVTADVVARLRPPPAAGAGSRSRAAGEAFALAERVGAAVSSTLGVPLRRAWNGFADEGGSTYVQVIAGRRRRVCSKYVFRFNPAMRARLDAAPSGWVALAPLGQDYFLMVPWVVAGAAAGRPSGNDRFHLYVPVSHDGAPGAFAEHMRPLPRS